MVNGCEAKTGRPTRRLFCYMHNEVWPSIPVRPRPAKDDQPYMGEVLAVSGQRMAVGISKPATSHPGLPPAT